MLAKIFRALEHMHKEHWDEAAGNVFGAIADWLENFTPMPL